MAPLAHTRGGGCRSASPRPHLFLSLIVMLSALFVPASGFLVSPGGVLPRSGSGAMHSATRSGRLQPAGGLLVNVRRGARFQSSTSETFGCALSVAPDEEEERKRQFEVQRGKAVDTLLTDYPVIFSKQCDFSIFDPAIVLSDAQGFHVEGIRAYRTFFSVVPTLVNVCFSSVKVSAMLMDKHGIEKGRIRIRWRIDLIPRFSGASFGDVFNWLDSNGDGVISSHEYFNSQSRIIRHKAGPRPPLVVEGISAYSLDAKGFVTQHLIEVTSPTSISPLASLRDLLPVRRSQGMVTYPTPMWGDIAEDSFSPVSAAATTTGADMEPAEAWNPGCWAVGDGASSLGHGPTPSWAAAPASAPSWAAEPLLMGGVQGLMGGGGGEAGGAGVLQIGGVMASEDEKGVGGANSRQGNSEGKGLMGGKGIGMKLPKQCKSDFDCNPGGFNFPLRCVDFVIASFCIDKDDDWKGGGLGALAWGMKDLIPEPIPVRVDDGWTRTYPPPDV